MLALGPDRVKDALRAPRSGRAKGPVLDAIRTERTIAAKRLRGVGFMGWSAPDKEVIKEGVWLYAGDVLTDVRIVAHPITYGSGDWEDADDIQDDRPEPSFAVEWGSPGERGVFRSAVLNFSDADAAIRHVQDSAPGLVWND